jgi:hypothetical protein
MNPSSPRPIRSIFCACLCFVFGAAIPITARGEMIYFDRITVNAPTDIASQFSAAVTSIDATHIQFEFRNSAVIASSITDIYFDDGANNPPNILSGLSGIIDHSTSFESGANPPNLPSGSNLTPSFTADFSAQSTNHPPTTITNGVDHSTDSVVLKFSLLPSITFNQVLDALSAKSLRISLHVQGIPITGGTTSDSFASGSIVPVPEPSAFAILGMSVLGFLAYAMRRRSI